MTQPVYHNPCGQRTLVRPCTCHACTTVAKAAESIWPLLTRRNP